MKKMSSWLSTGKFNEKDEYYTPPLVSRADYKVYQTEKHDLVSV